MLGLMPAFFATALTDSLTMQQTCQLQHRLCGGQSQCTFWLPDVIAMP